MLVYCMLIKMSIITGKIKTESFVLSAYEVFKNIFIFFD